MIILLAPPFSYPHQGGTSVTDAWRSSVYHVTAVAPWAWNATVAEKRTAYQSASSAMDNLRRITPDAAYLVRSMFQLLRVTVISELYLGPRTKPTSTNRIMKVRNTAKIPPPLI